MKLIAFYFACLCSSHASVVFFSDFEDNNIAPEIGRWDVPNVSRETSYPSTGGDPVLGNTVVLFDRKTSNPGIFYARTQLLQPVSLYDGNTFNVSFDYAARRTNGFSKTVYIELHSVNGVAAQFVLGDTGAFGNGQSDRQRPRYGTEDGRFALASSYFWGSDTDPLNGFDTSRDAHFSITLSAAGLDVVGTRQNGANNLAVEGLPLWNSNSHLVVTHISIYSEGNDFGFYLDNLKYESIAAVPEPAFSIMGFASGLFLLLRRRR